MKKPSYDSYFPVSIIRQPIFRLLDFIFCHNLCTCLSKRNAFFEGKKIWQHRNKKSHFYIFDRRCKWSQRDSQIAERGKEASLVLRVHNFFLTQLANLVIKNKPLVIVIKCWFFKKNLITITWKCKADELYKVMQWFLDFLPNRPAQMGTSWTNCEKILC